MPRKVLAIAASTGRVGFVYLIEGELMDWGISVKASTSVDEAFQQVTQWLLSYAPDLLIVEAFNGGGRKGRHTKSLVQAFEAAAAERDVVVSAVKRAKSRPNKYAAAKTLTLDYPQVEPWLPAPRQWWENEPRNIIIFEALALAVAWMDEQGLRDEAASKSNSDIRKGPR